jgi:hypothetical protein
LSDLIRASIEAVLDRSPDELIGAILAALVISAALAGVYAAARGKVRDRPLLVGGLILIACAVSMALAAGYLHQAEAGPALTSRFNGIVFEGVSPTGPRLRLGPGPR